MAPLLPLAFQGIAFSIFAAALWPSVPPGLVVAGRPAPAKGFMMKPIGDAALGGGT